MTCVGSPSTIGGLAGDGTEMTMTEATTTTTVSRRSTRLLAKDQESVDTVFAGIAYETRYSSSSDEDREESPRETSAARSSPEPRKIPDVDLGIDLSGIFPTTPEDIGKQGMLSLESPH
jgi:tyrosine-protein phosphatase SIW14